MKSVISSLLLLQLFNFGYVTGGQKPNQRTTSRPQLCNDTNQAFHNETQACYTHAGVPVTRASNKPCGELMFFYKESQWSPYGVCDCMADDDCRYPIDFHRPILNWPGSKRCYYAYEQGPCKSGEWIVMNRKTFQSECQKNPCAGKKIKEIPRNLSVTFGILDPNVEIFWFTKNETCFQTFTQAYCKSDEIARFLRTNPFPFCAPINSEFGCGSAGTTATLPCPQGHKRVGDDCSPVADFQ